MQKSDRHRFLKRISIFVLHTPFITNMKTQLPYRLVLLLTIFSCTLPGVGERYGRRKSVPRIPIIGNLYI